MALQCTHHTYHDYLMGRRVILWSPKLRRLVTGHITDTTIEAVHLSPLAAHDLGIEDWLYWPPAYFEPATD